MHMQFPVIFMEAVAQQRGEDPVVFRIVKVVTDIVGEG